MIILKSLDFNLHFNDKRKAQPGGLRMVREPPPCAPELKEVLQNEYCRSEDSFENVAMNVQAEGWKYIF